MATFFTNQPLTYDRRYPPLFFTATSNPQEEAYRIRSVQRVAREYFRLGSRSDTTHSTCMSNGMTLGEYAMYICVNRNDKRRK